MDDIEFFLAKTLAWLKFAQERQRVQALVARWASQWTGPRRAINLANSNHGVFLHFDQLIGTTWSHVFFFHAAPRHGFTLKGPDTDRIRKSHKHRANPLDRSALDDLFEAWSLHPEARPAGNAVELHLDEAPDEVWEVFLQEALTRL